MPKRTDIKSILIIGAGPIVIGQACEFDYSGSQACKAIREEGYRVILVNSNPATIMTDPEMADATYIEPVTPEFVEKIIEKERPDALLPTVGGQTALNVASALYERGVLAKYGVQMIGANYDAIKKAEDRDEFKKAMTKIGLGMTESVYIKTFDDAMEITKRIPFPLIIRPSYTLGGSGGSIAYNMEEYRLLVRRALDESPVHEAMIEESIIGWKEYELEVMRDKLDNVVIICSIENFDPIGIHTGDSVTVAPQQTLTDTQYQKLRDYSIKVIREIGVDTGGSNIQFAVNQYTGDVKVIEMNPRVSRSSALASKATGFPIAKIAAKLAVGYTLDEIPNDITRETPACFEPTIDYCVVKIPRFAFEKFKGAKDTLGIQMKSVGETMSIGRTFKEALQKGCRSLEIKKDGFDGMFLNYENGNVIPGVEMDATREKVKQYLTSAQYNRLFYIKDAMQLGMSIDDIYEYTKIDKWFLCNMKEILDFEKTLKGHLRKIDREMMRTAKQIGFSDKQIAYLTNTNEREVRDYRKSLGILPTYKLVDTCGGEFEAKTPYYYSTYDVEDESVEVSKDKKEKVIILGGGPNRIGQGIEFDYCCVHAVFALRKLGYETIMINSNPETVSTDYDTSDKLYFEPLTLEDVLNIVEKESPLGVIIQLGGQTPLNLALKLESFGVPILGTSPKSIDIAEDRDKFKLLLEKNGFLQPKNDTAYSADQALKIANIISYPVVVRPSYVLGGRAMQIVFGDEDLKDYMTHAIMASPEHPILIDKYLERATEIDVDAVCDGTSVTVAGIMEHIEEAGIHSGDSACVIPPYTLSRETLRQIEDQTTRIAKDLNVVGLINIQFALKDGDLYFLEVNPRASRTVPFVSKATGIPWAKVAAHLMVGRKLKSIKLPAVNVSFVAVKEAVLPFNKFPEVDIILGPEMRSTGEVMGIDASFGMSYTKSQIAANQALPFTGTAFLSFKGYNREYLLNHIRVLKELGFKLLATEGTQRFLKENGVEAEVVPKFSDAVRPNIVDKIINGEVNIVFNTPEGKGAHDDDKPIRRAAINNRVPCVTTIPGIIASIEGIAQARKAEMSVRSLQEIHSDIPAGIL
ncbi:MAG: carbamoyl-phosphate synthase large subunit [Spirochaetes bacterium]|nr:carbamoyl-phosphate synthase large subunit [Spirochaetota bacterium]